MKNYLLSKTALEKCGKLDEINNEEIATKDHLKLNDSGDNDSIRKLKAKRVVDPLINSGRIAEPLKKEEVCLCPIKLKDYISSMPSDEISLDIPNMFNFIVDEIRKLERTKHGKK